MRDSGFHDCQKLGEEGIAMTISEPEEQPMEPEPEAEPAKPDIERPRAHP